MFYEKSSQKQLIEDIQCYVPFDEIEGIEKIRFINFLENNKKVYSRENLT